MRYLIALLAAVLGVAGVAAWVHESEPDWYLRTRYPLEYAHIVRGHAKNHDLDPALLAAVIYAESRFDPSARSDAGAVGLMQLLPETAKGIALRTGGSRFVVADLFDPEINVRYGSWYLDHLRERYSDIELALAAYHAGQGSVDRWRREGTSIAFPETRSYVDEVARVRKVYAEAYPAELGLGYRRRAPPERARSAGASPDARRHVDHSLRTGMRDPPVARSGQSSSVMDAQRSSMILETSGRREDPAILNEPAAKTLRSGTPKPARSSCVCAGTMEQSHQRRSTLPGGSS